MYMLCLFPETLTVVEVETLAVVEVVNFVKVLVVF
jgi:hypothetical protein